MTKEEIKNKHIAVIGLGVEGYSSVLYLATLGAKVVVLDSREDVAKPEELVNKGVAFVLGKEYLSHLTGIDVIVRSPGVKRNLPQLVEAEAKGIIITSQTQLFLDWSPAQVIGVTGTKGKGTTSALIYEMLKAQGYDAYLGGNIGKPPFDFLDTLTEKSKVVLELSSFQLEDVTKSPHIAVMLMVTAEHLGADTVGTQNYHESIEDYVAAKRNIATFQTPEDILIVNRDYPASHESDAHTIGTVYQVSRERGVLEDGCYVQDGFVWVKKNRQEERIIATKDILLPGGHNLENVCGATMAARLAGVSREHIADVLKTFKGLEHRLELVGEVHGVKYYDDSFSTTPETAIAAIQAFKQPEVLILGGSSKNSDFTELGSVIAKADNIRAIIGIGIEWERIKEAIQEHDTNVFMVEGAKDMATVVQAASKIAQKGDVVLLSPACASFGMFPNYKVRGEQFKEEVKKLQQ